MYVYICVCALYVRVYTCMCVCVYMWRDERTDLEEHGGVVEDRVDAAQLLMIRELGGRERMSEWVRVSGWVRETGCQWVSEASISSHFHVHYTHTRHINICMHLLADLQHQAGDEEPPHGRVPEQVIEGRGGVGGGVRGLGPAGGHHHVLHLSEGRERGGGLLVGCVVDGLRGGGEW